MREASLRILALCVISSLGIGLAAAEGAATAGSSPSPRFQASYSMIPKTYRQQMTSWKPGCPVSLDDLRVIRMTHWGFDGRVRWGQLIIHEDYASSVVRAFRGLYESRFPIRRMNLVERYGSDDNRSMAADNTSAFNCRGVPGSGSWSEHAYGRAIDLNPLENPEVRDGVVSPPGGRAFLDRIRYRTGMIRDNDLVVRAFASIGWRWGGYWRSLKDYQHFSATGR